MYDLKPSNKKANIHTGPEWSFHANNMKSALIMFRNKVKGNLGSSNKVKEFGLVSNKKLLLTTSAFKEFFKKPVEKP